MLRTNNPETSPAVADYCRSIGEHYCPYVMPALQQKVLYFTEYRCVGENLTYLQQKLFYTGLLHTELLRQERVQQKTKLKAALLCENVVFHLGTNGESIDGRELFDWPHWCLKILYTEVGILFGKFWQGEEDFTRDGRSIPKPPCHILSIRSAVKAVDHRFFQKAPDLHPEFEQSRDDGRNVLDQIPAASTPQMVKLLKEVRAGNLCCHRFEDLIAEFQQTTLYTDVIRWCENKQIGLRQPAAD